jgi:hypothetical protein
VSDRDGEFSPDAIDRAVAEVPAESPLPFQLSLGEIRTAARNWPHLAGAPNFLLLLGSAAWTLRETFEEALRDLGRKPRTGCPRKAGPKNSPGSAGP